MNKLEKIITTGLVVASMGVIGANAETKYIEGKKYNFIETDIESEENIGVKLFNYNNKLYTYPETTDNLFELIVEDKVKSIESDIKYSTIEENFKDFDYSEYEYDFESNTITKTSYDISGNSRGSYSATINTNDINIISENPLEVNGKIYLKGEVGEELYILAYNSYISAGEFEHIKTFSAKELLDSINVNYEENDFDMFIISSEYSDAFLNIVLTKDDVVTNEYIFNYDGSLFMEFDEELKESEPLYSDGTTKFLYVTKTDDNYNLQLKDDKSNITILKSKSEINVHYYEGFIIVRTDKDSDGINEISILNLFFIVSP